MSFNEMSKMGVMVQGDMEEETCILRAEHCVVDFSVSLLKIHSKESTLSVPHVPTVSCICYSIVCGMLALKPPPSSV